MAEQRIVAIAIALTPEQQRQIQTAGGAMCTEAVFVGPSSSTSPLANELTSKEDQALARVLWQSRQSLDESARAQREVMEGYDHSPTLVFFR